MIRLKVGDIELNDTEVQYIRSMDKLLVVEIWLYQTKDLKSQVVKNYVESAAAPLAVYIYDVSGTTYVGREITTCEARLELFEDKMTESIRLRLASGLEVEV